MINVFLPLMIILRIFTIGTIVPVQMTGYNYEVSTTSVAILHGRDGGTSVIVGVSATNFHEDVLFIGEINFRAYDQNSGAKLHSVPCVDGVQFALSQNESDSGTLCWTSDKFVTDVLIIYDHSFFVYDTAAWSTME